MSPKHGTRTATGLVRDILSNHPPLSSSQIFKIATEGLRPVLAPAVAFRRDGSIRMKRVGNMREGSRIWVPPAQVPFPNHPFQSMAHLKKNVLAQLEMQNLISKVLVSRPLESEQEKSEAIRKAAMFTRRREARARKAGTPPPEAVAPETEVKEYKWALIPSASHNSDPGPAPRSSTTFLPATFPAAPYTSPFPSSGLTMSDGQVYKWSKAERLEAHAAALREMERSDIERKREERAAHWSKVRDDLRLQKAEDKASGRWDILAHRRKVQRAREEILRYAEQTGEDVSSWLEELDAADVDEGEMDMEDPYVKAQGAGKERRKNVANAWGNNRLIGRVSPERRRKNEEVAARQGQGGRMERPWERRGVQNKTSSPSRA